MSNPSVAIEGALLAARALAAKANALVAQDFDYYNQEGGPPENDNADQIDQAIETAFFVLLNLAEALGLTRIREAIEATYQNARSIGFSRRDQFEDLSAWSYWSTTIERLADSIAAVYGLQQRSQGVVSTDLLTLLQSMETAITDKRCFQPPTDEAEVHDRIEAVLRCIYPDLRRKPPLPKAVVNFIPDTGIPSIQSLVEYKFMSDAAQAGLIANQILADTRGYAESGWKRLVFVIYETKRFNTIHEWRQLLRGCGVPETVEVVLLHGETPTANKNPGSIHA